MFVVIMTTKKPQEREKHLAAHRAMLQKYYDRKMLVCSGPQIPSHGGVVISCAPTREEVGQMIEEDPFYIHGVCDYQVIEFDPVKYAPEFEPFIRK